MRFIKFKTRNKIQLIFINGWCLDKLLDFTGVKSIIMWILCLLIIKPQNYININNQLRELMIINSIRTSDNDFYYSTVCQ